MTSKKMILNLKETQLNVQKKVGKNIQKIRESKGLSQVDLAAKMIGKFDTTNISRIESGRTNPTLFTLFRIAKALDISIKELLNVKI